MEENLHNELSANGFNICKKAVMLAYFANGQELGSKDEVETVTSLLIDHIRKVGYDLLVEELVDCLHNGSFGQYGKVYKVSLNTMSGWIETYMQSTDYLGKVAKRRKKPLAISEKATMTDAERTQIMQVGTRKCFENFKETGLITGNLGGCIYNWLSKIDGRLDDYKPFLSMAYKRIANEKDKIQKIGYYISTSPDKVAKDIALEKYFNKIIKTLES